ncbi:hypothetical protein ACQ4LE_008721 [Meloidogyne hapla]
MYRGLISQTVVTQETDFIREEIVLNNKTDESRFFRICCSSKNILRIVPEEGILEPNQNVTILLYLLEVDESIDDIINLSLDVHYWNKFEKLEDEYIVKGQANETMRLYVIFNRN